MTLVPTSEQSAICEALDDLLTGADTPSVARSWGSGRPTAGIDLWRRLGEMGLWGVLAPESAGGMGGCTMDAVVALERLGFHAVPGPPWRRSASSASSDRAQRNSWPMRSRERGC